MFYHIYVCICRHVSDNYGYICPKIVEEKHKEWQIFPEGERERGRVVLTEAKALPSASPVCELPVVLPRFVAARKKTLWEAFIKATQTNGNRSQDTIQYVQMLNWLIYFLYIEWLLSRDKKLGTLHETLWVGGWSINRSAYPWHPELWWRTGCELWWRMAKCWCCFGGNLTWEEDWHWCLERLSVQGNSRRWQTNKKKNALFLVSNICEKESVDSIAEVYIFLWHLQGCSEVKVIGFWGGRGGCLIKRGKASAVSLSGLTSWTQTSRKDQIKRRKVSSLRW